MGSEEFHIVEIPNEEPQNYTEYDTRTLICQLISILDQAETQKKSWNNKMKGKILDEKEQAFATALDVFINFMRNEKEGSYDLLEKIITENNGNSGNFERKLNELYDKIKKSMELVRKRVDYLVERLSNGMKSDAQLEKDELFRKVHEEIYSPIRRIMEQLEALRRVNQESGPNNTGTKECEAIIKNWATFNIPLALADITFYISTLIIELPDKMWLTNLKDLLRTIDTLKTVDWWYDLVIVIANGEKEKIRDFDDQLKNYNSALGDLLPTFKNLLESLSGYEFGISGYCSFENNFLTFQNNRAIGSLT